MTIGLLREIAEIRPRNARLLGMDIGKKTLGLALCDPAQSLATPLATIKRTKFTKDLVKLEAIVKDYEVEGFIIGLPLNMDDSEGPRCQAVRDFAAELLKYPAVVGDEPWIALHDERFSTVSADILVDGSVSKRKAKDKGITDMLAAQVILQSALDSF
ncbi:MAG: Holliday junction resolvase RuvX [Alphaproteobacteria bacterium]